jgi:hypothetical protein
MTPRSVRLAVLVWLLLPAAAGAAADDLKVVRIRGETPSVYSRPVIDDRYLIGQATRGEEYPVLTTLRTDLPSPFYRVLFHSRPGWVYGAAAELVTRDRRAIPEQELASILRLQRSPEELIGAEVRVLLDRYDSERRRLAALYRLDGLPALQLSEHRSSGPFHLDLTDNSLRIRLQVASADGQLWLPRSDRFVFQAIVALAFDRLAHVEACTLILERGPHRPVEATLTRDGWDSAVDLSPEAFWDMAAKRNADDLWRRP